MATTGHPQRRIFVGRQREIEQFRGALERMREDDEALHEWANQVGISFDIDAAPRNLSYPHLFILHGVGGMGKSWLTWRLIDVTREDFVPPFDTVYVDVSTRPQVVTGRDLLFQLARGLQAESYDMSDFFRLARLQPEVEARLLSYQAEHREFWEQSLEIVAQTAAVATNVAGQFFGVPGLGTAGENAIERVVTHAGQRVAGIASKAHVLLTQRMQDEGKLTAEEADLFMDPEGALSDRLVDSLKQVAVDTPLVIALDTLETVVQLEPFIRDRLITPCADSSIIFIIAGRHNLSHERRVEEGSYRGLHKGFADPLGNINPPVVFDLSQFAAPEIRDYLLERASEEAVGLEEVDVLLEAIQAASGGVPLAVELTVDAALRLNREDFHASFSFASYVRDLLPNERIAELTDRFLRYCLDRPDDLEKVYALAVLRKGASEGALRAVWKLPRDVIVRDARAHLTACYAFMRGGELHDEVRRFVRRQLLTDPGIEETRRELGRSIAVHYESVWQREAEADPDLADRVAEERYREVTLDLLNAYFWLEDGQAIEFLCHRWVEAYPFDRSFCRRLLEAAEEFTETDGFLRKRERNNLNLLQQLTVVRGPVDFLDAWEASSRHDLRGRRTGDSLRHDDADERVDRLRRLLTVGEKARWWHPLHTAALNLAIGQGLEEQGQHERALAAVLKAAEDIQDLVEQEALRTKLADLGRDVGWALGFVSHTKDSMFDPVPSPKAIQAYQVAVSLAPDQGDAHRRLGRLYTELREYDNALASHLQAIEVEPDATANWLALGYAHLHLAEYTKATAAFSRALEIDPKLGDAMTGLGDLHRDLAQYEEAIAAYNKTLELNPRHVRAWSGLGDVCIDLGEYEEAISAYQKAIGFIGPVHGSAALWSRIGVAQMQQVEFEKAVSSLNTAVELAPGEAIWFRNRAEVLILANRLDEAEIDIARAEELAPTHPFTLGRRAQILYARGEYRESINEYRHAATLATDHTEFNLELALPLLCMGDVDGALGAIVERLNTNVDLPNRVREALIHSRHLQVRWPQLPGLDEALARLQDAAIRNRPPSK